MKLIGAGLPRTATLTQRAALEILGLAPCYHMQNVFADMAEVARWRDVLDGRLTAAEILDGYPAMVDWPGSYYYRELMESYPDAKVLLSVRDGQAWAQSMQDTIWGLFYDDTLIRHVSDARTKVDPVWAMYIEMMKEMWRRTQLLDGEATTPQFMSTAMERYNDEVRAAVPAEKLLEWSPKDGWGPLCEFLEVPVPDEPVPHINDTTQFVEQIVHFSVQVLSDQVLVAPCSSTAKHVEPLLVPGPAAPALRSLPAPDSERPLASPDAERQLPAVVWLTGPSGAGKTTIARALELELNARGLMVGTLDGDDLRTGLCADLGFSEADRSENVRRAAAVAQLMTRARLIVIVSLISPFRAGRAQARALFAADEFFEAFVDTPLSVAECRDPKGLYRRARQGELTQFTGIDSPYEPPECPEITLDTVDHTVAECARSVLDALVRAGRIPA